MSGPVPQTIVSTVRLPLVAPASTSGGTFRSGSTDATRKYWNCFPVVHKDPLGNPEYWIERRQPIGVHSFDLSATLGAVNSNAVYNMTMTQLDDVSVCAVWDNTNSKFVIIQYRPQAGTQVKIGELTGAAVTDEIFLSELLVGTTPTLGVVYHNSDNTNSKGYFASSAAGVFAAASLTEITDVDFPPKQGTPIHITGPMVQMNGTTYVLTKSGILYNSDLNSITSWNALGFISAIQYPDQGIGLMRYKHHIIVFGEDSIEFFNDVGGGAPGSPLGRTDQAFIKFGCVHPRAFCTVDDVPYWMGRSSSGTNGLWKLDGYSPVKLSGQDEDQWFSVVYRSLTSGPHVGRLWPCSFNARKHVVIGTAGTGNGFGLTIGETFTGDTNSLSDASDLRGGHMCLDIEAQQFWAFRSSIGSLTQFFYPLPTVNFQANNADPNSTYFPGAYTTTASTTIGQSIFNITGNITNGVMGNTDFDGVGTNKHITMGVQLNSVDFGTTKRKRVNRVSLIQRGLGATSTAATLWFAWSKNQNTTNGSADILGGTVFRSVPAVSTVNRWYINNCGMARDWTFAVIYKGVSYVAFRELELELMMGST